jgi:hypothetical protein
MGKILILIFKTNLKIIGVDWKNGLFFVLFGLSEGHWMKTEEKHSTPSCETSNQYSQAITQYTIITSTQIRMNGRVGRRK